MTRVDTGQQQGENLKFCWTGPLIPPRGQSQPKLLSLRMFFLRYAQQDISKSMRSLIDKKPQDGLSLLQLEVVGYRPLSEMMGLGAQNVFLLVRLAKSRLK